MEERPDETLEQLVVRRIRQQLSEEGFLRLISGLPPQPPGPPQVRADFEGSGGLRVEVKATGIGEGTATAEVVAVLESKAPKLAEDAKSLSPEQITALFNLYNAVIQLLTTVITTYQLLHHQPPTDEHVTQVFNQITTTIINLSPPAPPIGPSP